MKKIILTLIFILTITTCSFASDVSVQINGEIINFKDDNGNIVNAQIINDRTMVPMRKIFEVLGATITWNGEEKIVTATKDNITIELQIDNLTATKTINAEKEEIKLDTPPMLVNDRTMVPLRFIAESLDKQVGWDKENKMAIIIDYSYFSKEIKSKAPALYNFLITNDDYIQFSVAHNYYDLQNAVNNTTYNLKLNSTVNKDTQNVALTITGTDELSREIANEGWNSTAFSLTCDEKSVFINSDSLKLKEMLKLRTKGISKTYEGLGLNNLENSSSNTVDDLFKNWAGVNDEELNKNTFTALKNDFSNLCNMFSTTNISSTSLTSKSSTIRYSTYKLNYFDLAKLDNFISSNEHLKLYNIVNKIFFKNDIRKDVVLYDTSSININFTVEDKIFKITIITENLYNEKNEYIIELRHL